MVTQWQRILYEDRFSHTHQLNPDFVALAESMYFQARRCSDTSELRDCLQWLVTNTGSALLEVQTVPKVSLLPLVAGGNALDEFVYYETPKQDWKGPYLLKPLSNRYDTFTQIIK
jgi:acetolactate synthase I/II/III large subunit